MRLLSIFFIIIVNYNVENLFHPAHDSVWVDSALVEKDDWEWTPEGERRWTYTRYLRKVENIARVLTNIGEWDGVDIVGMEEIENAECVRRLCERLRRGEYDFVHYESPDRRGIDVAFVYKKAKISPISSRQLKVDLGEETTRDILYVCAIVDRMDTIHFFVCHLPSQRGGAATSAWKREAAKKVLQQAVDSVLAEDQEAKIVVMGDMNTSPKNDITGLKNRMISTKGQSTMYKGTHKYQGRWTCLDQFYVSAALDSVVKVRIYDAEWIMEPDEKYLGMRPKRTFNGFRYQKDGFSDHLPIVMTIP